MAASSAEWFDVVDARDRVIGRETRSEVHRRGLLHRAVHILVYRPDGALFLQKRSAEKDTAPNRWVSSCSGHVDAGEDYEAAARRELGEELGIDGSTAAIELLAEIPAAAETGWEFVRLYAVRAFAGELHPDPREIAGGVWKSPKEVDEWIARAPGDFAQSFLYLWKALRPSSPSITRAAAAGSMAAFPSFGAAPMPNRLCR
ncbi:MAG: NUDIX hydrolase [Puniceicoccaceae bacterium]